MGPQERHRTRDQGEQYVNRHAKASSAGSIDSSSRSLFRRAFAIRGAFGDSKGSGAPATALCLLLAFAIALLLGPASALAAEPPVITAGAPHDADYSTVEVDGTIDPKGGFVEYNLEVSKDGGATWEVPGGFFYPGTNGSVNGEEEGVVGPQSIGTRTLEHLKPGTTYQFRIKGFDYTTGEEPVSAAPNPEFTTEALPSPTVAIDPVTTHTAATAELSGSITATSPAGNPAAADVHWHFECSPACTTSDEGTVAAGDSEAVQAEATGLQPNTAYTVTLVGENAGDPVSAGPVGFTTSILAPVAETLPTVALPDSTGPKMLLRGSVDSNNAPTEYWFEYGLTTGYGQLAPAGDHADAPAGRRHIVSQEVEGLAPGTTYHYQVVAEGPGGPSVGGDVEFTTAPAAGPGCFSGCRAYEMVSPLVKNGGDIEFPGAQTAPGGDSIIYQSRVSFGGGMSGSTFSSYRATRGASGWTTKPLLPPGRSGVGSPLQATVAASTDLSRQVATSFGGFTTEGLLVEPNDLVMLDASGSSTIVTVGQPPQEFAGPAVVGGSSDLSRVVFTDAAALTPGAPTPNSGPEEKRGNLYGWSSAGLRLLDVLPDGTIPSQGAVVGSDSVKGFLDHAISTDASRVFFTVPDDGSGSCPTLDPALFFPDCTRIYLRDDAFGPAPSTVEITANAGGPDAPGTYRNVFRGASADGTRAFFTSPAQLTPDATTGASHGGSDLYEYRLGGGLTDLTVDHGDANGANVLGVMGLSDDGSSIYFVATGRLDGQGVAGQPNLYLHRDGDPVRFVATLSDGDAGDWDKQNKNLPTTSSQVTPNGDHAVFISREPTLQPQESLTPTIYEYGVDTGLTCVSCNPSGAAPTVASSVPGRDLVAFGQPLGLRERRSITDDGSRVFFDSPEALVPQDTNGRSDVYVYEDGAPHLISSGRATDASKFVDASADGDNVFFLTREQLSGDDVDTNTDLYDARVGGTSVPPHVVKPSCQNDECRGVTPPQPAVPSPASPNFHGPGNPTPSKPLTKAQKLKRALKACKSKHGKAKQKKCEETARKRFGKSGGSK
jgi:hypothetical protein